MLDTDRVCTTTPQQSGAGEEAETRGVKEAPPGSATRYPLGLATVSGVLLLAVILAAGAGAIHVPIRTILCILVNHSGLYRFPRTWPKSDEVIILQIRLPRVAAAALVGAALSVAGVLFQGLFRNPMADPYVIGTSGGAALGATIGLILSARLSLWTFGTTPLFAFVGALATMALVYYVSRVGGRTPVVTLLLAGLAASVILAQLPRFSKMAAEK